MMPRIAARLCGLLSQRTAEMPPVVMPSPGRSVRCVRRPESFAALQTAWLERRPSLRLLETKLQTRFGRQPVVVGIDLRAKAKNPTGWAVCRGPQTETRVMFDDAEILDATLSVGPDLVSIDAPLFLPRGRMSVSDDSPCRQLGGIVRDAERILWSRGIRVYPALIRQMQGLTKRGIELTRILEAERDLRNRILPRRRPGHPEHSQEAA